MRITKDQFWTGFVCLSLISVTFIFMGYMVTGEYFFEDILSFKYPEVTIVTLLVVLSPAAFFFVFRSKIAD